jgi:acyl-coenzyme A synthetase/AMP-(fatty) acid ligase
VDEEQENMTLLQLSLANLEETIRACDSIQGQFVQDANQRVPLTDLLSGSALYGRGDELLGKSVLLATRNQLPTIASLIELDGVARRIVLCPPDLPLEHFPYVIETAETDGIVTDRAPTHFGKSRPVVLLPCSRSLTPRTPREGAFCETEWVLLTSGTTGLPKLVAHTFSSLTAAIQPDGKRASGKVWSTFYDIRRYGGLQILLRATLSGASLVLSSADEPTADFLARAGSSGVTHISGTPSHWRRALMSPSATLMNPEYVRLSGEAVDQAILDHLRSVYPQARIGHAFASTEAGVAFDVNDGVAGFPASTLTGTPGVKMKVEGNTLRIRSAGNAKTYLGENAPALKDETGYVNTKDVVELKEGRYFFAGRLDGVINVGGLKVHPEQVEAVISRHPDVHMCLVRAKKSPILGALVAAEVVLKTEAASANREVAAIQESILQLCRESLPPHKVPALVKVVPSLALNGSGKVLRQDA